MVASQAIIITVPADAGGDIVDMAAPIFESPSTTNRKRRLAHLSLEEKMYRKKLKNRVAAQTSRDRKKQRFDDLEETVGALEEEISSLKSLNERITAENHLLKQQLEDTRTTNATIMETFMEKERCSCGKSQKSVDQTAPASFPSITSRPAESMNNPLLKGLEGTTLALLSSLQIALMACLLYQNSSKDSEMKICRILKIWNASQKASYKKPFPAPMRRVILQRHWWGRHQNSWNPVDQIPIMKAVEV